MTKYYGKKVLTFLLLGTITLSSIFSTGCSRNDTDTTNDHETSASLIEEDTTATTADVNKSNKLTSGLYNNDITYSAEDLKIQQSFEAYLEEIFMTPMRTTP